MRELVMMFSFVDIDEKNNRKENLKSVKVTKEKQAWLAQHAVDVVVLAWSVEELHSLPSSTLRSFFEKTGNEVVAHVFPPDFDDIPSSRSISRCPREGREHAFAITLQSAGYGNLCDVPIETC